MATIKKAYVAIIDHLRANADLLVSDVLADIESLAVAKVGTGGGKATTFHRNEQDEVVAIQCYYHKRWFNPLEVEFGLKKTSASGLNSMCKDGQSKWNKQQAEAKKAEASLLDQVMSGELRPEDIEHAKADIAANAKRIEPLTDEAGNVLGHATLEELLDTL